jgi:FtsP/CotA-like multicopper oxidase with cupredoxin domain
VKIMAIRDVYLRIETLAAYSPLAPVLCSRRWGRDCMRMPGHELGRVTPTEIFAATIDAVVYREYKDPDHLHPVTDPLIAADENEPPWNRRVPGCVLYAEPGEQLHIHVHNADAAACHSFHLHGLRYAIDSDGAWPFGVRAVDGRRSDEIRPGASWTYVFDATPETIGAWPFHDHVRDVGRWIGRGLFGGLVVRDPKKKPAAHEVPLFVHQLSGNVAQDGFVSPALNTGDSWSHTFGQSQTAYPYHCQIHGTTMSGQVVVAAGGLMTATITVVDNAFQPAAVTVAPGGTVTWFNTGQNRHIVFAGGGGGASFCLNGRAYVGNTPTIVAEPGECLRWYVFNLDVGSAWHNFHPHATRWELPKPPGGASDVHGLSPVETFVVDTEVPSVVRLPAEVQKLQEHHPTDACRVPVRGDFLFHCHVEDHMMQGLAGLVRARDGVWITEAARKHLQVELPLASCDDCAPVDGRRSCAPRTHSHFPLSTAEQPAPELTAADQAMVDMAGMADATTAAGMMDMPGMGGMGGMGGPAPASSPLATYAAQGGWELAPCDSGTLAVHTALLRTGKVLFFSGSGNFPPRHNAHQYGCTVWDPQSGLRANPLVSHDVFCGGQAFLPNGDLLVIGGTKDYDPFHGLPNASLYEEATDTWQDIAPMADGRWYPTPVALGDGRVAVFSGANATNGALNDSVELYEAGVGFNTIGLTTPGWPLYPHVFLLDDGRLIYTGGSLGGGPGPQAIDLTAGTLTAIPGLRDPDLRGQSASVLLPPAQDQKLMVISGGGGNPFTVTTSVDIVDMKAANPAYSPAAPLTYGRTHLNAVLLPDRTVFVSGGGSVGEGQPVLQSEIYDTLVGTWSPGPTAAVARLYHSIAVLLPGGEVLTAGSNPHRGDDELRIEIFHPPYLFRGRRPFIESAPCELTYGERFTLHTPDADRLRWVQITRPMATTHSCDTEQRIVDLRFKPQGICELEVELPDNHNLAPPGWYLLTIVNHDRIPSCGEWLHLGTA